MSERSEEIEKMLGGRYKIIGVLGHGSMGAVYLAEDKKLLGKRWAIKEMLDSDFSKEGMASEAETLIRLNHPNLPHIVDYFPSESGQCGYLVMDYVEGETLLQRFERNGKLLSIDCVITYALQLCEVFEYLHGQQPNPIIHRDVKPANLMIDAHDRMTLIDFGIARKFKAGFANDNGYIPCS